MIFTIIPPFKAASAADVVANPEKTLGVEVTIPSVEALCGLGNVDHHREGDNENTPSACEQVLSGAFTRPPELVVGIMADADTLVAMALLKLGVEIDENTSQMQTMNGENVLWSNFPKCDEHWINEGVDVDLVLSIGKIDRFGPARCAEFLKENKVKAVRAIAANRSMDTEAQVSAVAEVLQGIISPEIQEIIKAADKAADKARKNAKIEVLPNGVVFVESADFAATQLGYEHGDVVIALNPEMLKDFKDPSAGTYRKFTVCKRDSHVPMDIDFNALNALEGAEGTWGGRPTIGGSPQGEDSTLTVQQVLSCIN